MCVYVYICIYVGACVCVHVYDEHMCMGMYMCVHECICVYKGMCGSAEVCIYMHMYAYCVGSRIHGKKLCLKSLTGWNHSDGKAGMPQVERQFLC